MPVAMPGLDEWVKPGTSVWAWCCLAAVAGRAADMLSTWIASPRLELEGNPLSRWLGWRKGILLNVVLVPLVACWPMVAVSLATMSALVAARNLQQAWLMRSMGEAHYRFWFAQRLAQAPRGLVMGCHWAEAILTGGIGGVLMGLGPQDVVSFGVGVGLAAYGFAVAFFTTLALRRGW